MADPKIFTVEGGATGTAAQLYLQMSAGVKNPPTMDAFRRRLYRGDASKGVLMRPPNAFTAAGDAARREGLRKHHAYKKKTRESAQVHEEKKSGWIPAAESEVFKNDAESHREIKLTGGKPYYRPGSLSAWPRLEEIK